MACLATTSVTHVGCADETRRCFCSYRVSAILHTALASLRGCVQRLQELLQANRLSMMRIMAMEIQASSLLGSTS